MKELAAMIRKGLEAGVKEDMIAWGVAEDGTGGPSANVVGLALIGKIGLDHAQELFESAIVEGGEEGPVTSEILHHLGISLEQSEALTLSHFRMRAAKIAEAIEAGLFEWEPA